MRPFLRGPSVQLRRSKRSSTRVVPRCSTQVAPCQVLSGPSAWLRGPSVWLCGTSFCQRRFWQLKTSLQEPQGCFASSPCLLCHVSKGARVCQRGGLPNEEVGALLLTFKGHFLLLGPYGYVVLLFERTMEWWHGVVWCGLAWGVGV